MAFKFSIVFVVLMAFNDKLIPYMSAVEFSMGYSLVSIICDECVDLIIHAVERFGLEAYRDNAKDAIKVPEIVRYRHVILEEGAIIHKLPNALADYVMPRSILKNLHIFRPADIHRPYQTEALWLMRSIPSIPA